MILRSEESCLRKLGEWGTRWGVKPPNLENTYFRGGAQQGQTHEERASFIYSWGDEKASCELREKKGEKWKWGASREPVLRAEMEQWIHDFRFPYKRMCWDRSGCPRITCACLGWREEMSQEAGWSGPAIWRGVRVWRVWGAGWENWEKHAKDNGGKVSFFSINVLFPMHKSSSW